MKIVKRVIIIIAIIAVIVFAVIKIGSKVVGNTGDAYDALANDVFVTYTVKRDNVKSYAKGIGTITSFNIETLTIDADEKISEILVSEGQKVEKNQDIMKVTDGSTTRTIKSSISGVFYCIEENNSTKYCIYNLDDVGVKLVLGEKEIALVEVGQKVSVNISALNKDLEGTVEYVASLPQNEKYTVRVKIDYTDDVKFGYSATASILTKEENDVVVIPYEYLDMDNDGNYFVYNAEYKTDLYKYTYEGMEEPQNAKIYVEVGTITSTKAQIVSGLETGDQIVKLFF
jgi:multidrug efflux pump subunit AcrA (membrane-fusion protein)